MADKNPWGEPDWRVRRTIIIATLFFCAGEIVYLTAWGEDTDLASTIANGVLILAGSVIASYVFGAAWDSRNKMAMRRGRRPHDSHDDGEDE